MDETHLNKPLISNSNDELPKDSSLLVSLVKWILKVVMWVVFLSWVVLILLYPAEFCDHFVRKWILGTPFGIRGSMFSIFTGPVLFIAVFAALYLIFSGEETFTKTRISKASRFRLWTFPILVDGPFGIVSAAEFLGILLFFLFLIWAMYSYTMQNLGLVSFYHATAKEQSLLFFLLTGRSFGTIGMLCLVFLFLPISRGSILLRIIDIPFEHAARYHVWLGHITMAFFSLHGLCFAIGLAIQGRLAQALIEWSANGVSNFPGVISLVSGLLMWVTSLHRVRENYFELFFYTHQLYVIFAVFLALHVGDRLFCIVAGGIFIFIVDRFLRFCQSRRTVDVLSAKNLPCGTVEIVLAKPANLQYNALSFIFLQARELSWLQWHPFSVSSSPLDGKDHMAVLIKVLGGWTAKLKDRILRQSEAEQQNQFPTVSRPKITFSVEGPYGHESPYHLMYENLVLVAGGIGISPFFAILSDILHRITAGIQCLPKKVLVVWAIKTSDELSLLSTINLHSICPYFSDKLKLKIDIYITQQSEPLLEDCMVYKDLNSSVRPPSNGGPMSVLVGTGDIIWSGLYIISSTVGFIATVALLDIFYINKFGVTTWWYKGLLFVVCMVASVVVFGGLVVVLWHFWGYKISEKEENDDKKVKWNGQNHDGSAEHEESRRDDLENFTTIRYGTRPDFRDIFKSLSGKWGGVDVGVIVCGPPSLQTSVAKEIRSHSIWRSAHHPVFHFNSHSFDL